MTADDLTPPRGNGWRRLLAVDATDRHLRVGVLDQEHLLHAQERVSGRPMPVSGNFIISAGEVTPKLRHQLKVGPRRRRWPHVRPTDVEALIGDLLAATSTTPDQLAAVAVSDHPSTSPGLTQAVDAAVRALGRPVSRVPAADVFAAYAPPSEDGVVVLLHAAPGPGEPRVHRTELQADRREVRPPAVITIDEAVTELARRPVPDPSVVDDPVATVTGTAFPEVFTRLGWVPAGRRAHRPAGLWPGEAHLPLPYLTQSAVGLHADTDDD